MTEDEFVAWCGPYTRAEWVDGEVIIMAPVSLAHADLFMWLGSILRSFVDDHNLGLVLGPEFFVRFPEQRRRRLPDILFVRQDRRDLLKKQYLDGAPDLIIEVVSPDSESRDWRDKYLEYERAGVREYWVIDPMSQHVEVYSLRKGAYASIPEKDGKLVSKVISGFWLKTEWLWQQPLPRVSNVLKELGAT
jgi:Uma2 family endonuclease